MGNNGVIMTEKELNEHLENNLKPTSMDYLYAGVSTCETEECQSGSRNYTAEMLNELEKRKGELLSVNCHDVNYVMY